MVVVLPQHMITGSLQVMSGHTLCSDRVFRHSSANESMVLHKGSGQAALLRGGEPFSLLQTLPVSVLSILSLYLDVSLALVIVFICLFYICISEQLTGSARGIPLQ